jgi:hypothetical protein
VATRATLPWFWQLVIVARNDNENGLPLRGLKGYCQMLIITKLAIYAHI